MWLFISLLAFTLLEVILALSSVEDFVDSLELLFTYLLLLQGPPLMVSVKNAVASFLPFTSLNHNLQNNLKLLSALLEVAVVNCYLLFIWHNVRAFSSDMVIFITSIASQPVPICTNMGTGSRPWSILSSSWCSSSPLSSIPTSTLVSSVPIYWISSWGASMPGPRPHVLYLHFCFYFFGHNLG